MAAITLKALTYAEGRNSALIRSAAAQANTGQTDWISVPSWADSAIFFLNMTASGGTTPGPTLMHLRSVDPVTLDDANIVTLLTATVGLTNTGLFVLEARGFSGTDVTNSATRNLVHLALPPVLGINVVLDRTNADETYTYTLRVAFKKRLQ
jgi:hypothetical protein